MTSPKSSSSCSMSPQDLQRAFDGESGAQDVAGHVASCAPCSSALELLQTQRDAVHYLSSPSGHQPPQSAVEHILAQSARAGRKKLADLLYEMAKACLIVLPDLKRRVNLWVEPRDPPVISGELNAINSRLDGADASVDVDGIPRSRPPTDAALTAARNCLLILENVEGKTARQRLGYAHLLLAEAEPEQAEAILRQLLEEEIPSDCRASAERNRLLSLLRQHSYTTAIEYGESVLKDRPSDPAILFNLAVASAGLRDKEQFRSVCTRLSPSVAARSPSWLVPIIKFEATNFASCLGGSVAEIEHAFGVPEEASGVAS